MARSLFSSIEALEARIAPANLTAYHPLLDLVAGMGKTGATIDLGAMLDSSAEAGYRSHVEFATNFDTDPGTPGIQPGKIVLELFNDKAPLTVQNFINYVNNANAHGDLDGVYFHRLVSGFVLQTGGFEASKIGQHIVVGEPVHNEFDPNDPERSNTVGTVAMAKVGGDPNSATSEFFFNLADNSGNLDHQNGGFTVFGKVVQGMDVVNAIASLPTVTINGGGAPYQNGYDPDPDHNASTPPPTPKANQVVQITNATVVAPHNSTSPHTAYSFSITDQMGNPTDLVTGKLVGDSLALKYKPGASGVATVTVHVTDTVTHETLPDQQFEVTVKPNLIAHSAGDTLSAAIVAGDTAKASVKLVNTGGAAATGAVDVKFFLSHVDGTDSSGNALGSDPTGALLDASDVQIGSILGANINIASGKNAVLTGDVTIPAGSSLTDGTYRMIAQITEPDGSTITELFNDDNVMDGGRLHGFFTHAAAPNLTALGMADNLSALIVPGDTGLAKLGIGNNASHAAIGNVDVQFYLSLDTNPLNSTDTLDANDILIGHVSQALNLAAGKAITVEAPLQIPQSLQTAEGYYHIIGLITSPDGASNIVELTNADNLTASHYHLLQDGFGTFSIPNTLLGNIGRTNAVLTYADSAQHLVSLKIDGKGFGQVAATTSGGIQVQIDGTTLASKFSIAAPATIHPVLANVLTGYLTGAPIGTLALGNVDFTGSVIAYGGARSVTLGNTSGAGDHFLGLGASAAATAAKVQPVVKLGAMQDLSFTSDLPVASLSAVNWTDVNATTELVRAVGLASFSVTGNFEADMNIAAMIPASTGMLKTFTVGGALKNSEVHISGNVGAVSLGAIDGSKFLVGANQVPTSLHDFNFVRSIASIVINGGAAGENFGIADSDIAAARFGKIVINAPVDTASGPDTFGFVADKIASYQRGGAAPIRNLDAGQTVDPEGHYQVTVLA